MTVGVKVALRTVPQSSDGSLVCCGCRELCFLIVSFFLVACMLKAPNLYICMYDKSVVIPSIYSLLVLQLSRSSVPCTHVLRDGVAVAGVLEGYPDGYTLKTGSPDGNPRPGWALRRRVCLQVLLYLKGAALRGSPSRDFWGRLLNPRSLKPDHALSLSTYHPIALQWPLLAEGASFPKK